MSTFTSDAFVSAFSDTGFKLVERAVNEYSDKVVRMELETVRWPSTKYCPSNWFN